MASPPHIVLFPFMSQGHILPLLDISKALSRRGLKITIISSSPPHHYPSVQLTTIPFPDINGLPKGCDNTAQLPSLDLLLPFLQATVKLQLPFEHILQEMIKKGSRPICVISDFFLGWTLATCREFNIPRLVFHGMGALSMAICKSVWKHNQHRIVHSDTVPLLLPETHLRFTLTKSDLPEHIRFLEDNHPLLKFIGESGETDVESWGVIVNSFAELEGCHLSFLEQFYKNNAKAWFVGPGLFHNDKVDNDIIRSLSTTILLDWLEGHVSVIYISFGSQAQVCDDDLNEIFMGLEMSGQDFLWAMKSKTWSPPNGWDDRVRNRGLIVREWVDQRSILAHKSVGGFLSHCGWNSVLESLSLGVPLLALPLNAEQPLNAKQVVDELGAGLN
ncbi:hypothetical protein LguiA_018841 [Lonicera macranthoides]